MGHPYCGFSVVLPKVTLQSLPILSPLIPDPHSLCPSLLLRCQVLFCVSLSVSRLLRLNHCHSHELCDFSARQTLTHAPLDDALHLCGRPERLQPPHSFLPFPTRDAEYWVLRLSCSYKWPREPVLAGGQKRPSRGRSWVGRPSLFFPGRQMQRLLL